MLYFVPTPIGNIEDITLRAKRILEESTHIICEDPRQIDKLLKLLEIRNNQSYIQILHHHEFNRLKIQDVLLQYASSGTVSMVSDAGTPGISDPGNEIVKLSQELSVPYSVLPGATSIIPAISASGLVYKEFLFLGFLPIKKGRQKIWQYIIRSQYPVVIMESVHRISKFINEAKTYCHCETDVFFSREISKTYEQYYSTTIQDLDIDKIEKKGEFVIIIKNYGVLGN